LKFVEKELTTPARKTTDVCFTTTLFCSARVFF